MKNKFKLFLILTIGLAVLLSVISYIYYLNLGVTVAYNDSRAHLNMARLVVDNLKPGLAQMGSVWLPLNHFLMLPFVWNYTLWQTGFAGSIASMITFVLSSMFIYLVINQLLRKPHVAFIGALLFMLNPNVLYMQTTPMTELTLIMFFMGASYFLLKWVNKDYNIIFLVLSGFMVFGATLTRYDGWFLFLCMLPVIVGITIGYHIQKEGKLNKKTLLSVGRLLEGRLILFSTVSGFGIFLWLVWNKIIYGQALYFMVGPYSAYAQQDKIKKAGSLPTFHDLPLSLASYWWAMLDNAGSLLLAVSIIGLILFAFKYKLSPIALAVYTLLTPFFFHVLSLYAGNSILVVPELGSSTTQHAHTSWFNVRYGLMMLPAVAVFSAYFARKSKLLLGILVLLIILQASLLYARNDVITLTDGVIGTSSLDVGDASNWLKANVKTDNGRILTSIAYNNALAFSIGIPLNRIIHEGTGKYWTTSLTQPTKYTKWIVMANADVGDEVYTSLVKNKNSDFQNNFALVMKGKHTNIYENKSYNEGILGTTDEIGAPIKDLGIFGVNSYDLSYRTHKQIDETLKKASLNGVRVIRFWAFGEGFEDSFQPQKGEYNYERFDSLAYAINSAKENNIQVIIALSNYWKDYGGIEQYLKWEKLSYSTTAQKDQFYINKDVQNNYKNFVLEVLNYKSKYTNSLLKNESAILGWEPMNEPRSANLDTSKYVVSWLDTVSSYIKTADPNHKVFAGIEGYTKEYHPGNYGPLLEDVAKIKNIDVLTGHFYIKEGENVKVTDVLTNWAKIQNSSRKPLIVEEVGFVKNARENGNVERLKLFETVFEGAKKEHLSGVLLWNWALAIDTSFGISPNDPDDKEVLKEIKTQSKVFQTN